jgi:hypothetical protein
MAARRKAFHPFFLDEENLTERRESPATERSEEKDTVKLCDPRENKTATSNLRPGGTASLNTEPS